ncbi:MAG TPA: EutN/CcmL family microcompartment protein [Bdellovibrionota bacterium]|nr:EutN/CcmL family microcompartment protein [Bdellovibrionota bacterium]
MQLGRVVGTVVASQKDPQLEGLKFHIVESTDLAGASQGKQVVAVDSVGAGTGELVLFASGSSARQTEATNNRPVDAVIMAIVDSIEVGGELLFRKSEAE